MRRYAALLVPVFLVAVLPPEGVFGGLENLNHFTSTYQALCYDTCGDRDSTEYTWCNTDEGSKKWDYCSVLPNVDINGDDCRTDHKCGLYESSYSWCNLEKGGWNYCGVTKTKDVLYIGSRTKAACLNKCDHHGESYFWCTTSRGWDYCSLAPDTTTNGLTDPCKEDHPCGLHGYAYYWCYTKRGSWDYCGPVLGKI